VADLDGKTTDAKGDKSLRSPVTLYDYWKTRVLTTHWYRLASFSLWQHSAGTAGCRPEAAASGAKSRTMGIGSWWDVRYLSEPAVPCHIGPGDESPAEEAIQQWLEKCHEEQPRAAELPRCKWKCARAIPAKVGTGFASGIAEKTI